MVDRGSDCNLRVRGTFLYLKKISLVKGRSVLQNTKLNREEIGYNTRA